MCLVLWKREMEFTTSTPKESSSWPLPTSGISMIAIASIMMCSPIISIISYHHKQQHADAATIPSSSSSLSLSLTYVTSASMLVRVWSFLLEFLALLFVDLGPKIASVFLMFHLGLCAGYVALVRVGIIRPDRWRHNYVAWVHVELVGKETCTHSIQKKKNASVSMYFLSILLFISIFS